MSQAICRSFLAFVLLAQACNKTVVSDKVVPVSTPVARVATPDTGMGNAIPDTKAIIRLTKANCDNDDFRKSSIQLKVAGLVNTDWIEINCGSLGREMEIDTKKGYCNVLQMKAAVKFNKPPLDAEDYTRSTDKPADLDFFQVTPKTVNGSVSGINIDFEDTNNAYWKDAYKKCLENPDSTINPVPIVGGSQSCKIILEGQMIDGKLDKAVDWNDLSFSVESDEVQFAVEGFPNRGCKPN